jgi:hypothetical protein
MRPLSSTITTIAIVSATSPSRPETIAAATRTRIMKLVNCSASIRHGPRRTGSGIELGPYAAARRAAALEDNPRSGSTRKRAVESAAESTCQTVSRGASAAPGSSMMRGADIVRALPIHLCRYASPRQCACLEWIACEQTGRRCNRAVHLRGWELLGRGFPSARRPGQQSAPAERPFLASSLLSTGRRGPVHGRPP